MEKVYLIRHGEPEYTYNAAEESVIYGPDVPLSEIGKEGVELLAERLKSSSLEVLYTSPYPRALQTAEIIGKTLEIPIIEHKDLHDLWTPGWTGETFKKFNELGQNIYAQPLRTSDQETWEMLVDRIVTTYEEIKEETKDKKIVGIVGHGDPLSALLYYIKTGEKPEKYENIQSEYIARTEACKMVLDHEVVYEFIAGSGSPKSGQRPSEIVQ